MQLAKDYTPYEGSPYAMDAHGDMLPLIKRTYTEPRGHANLMDVATALGKDLKYFYRLKKTQPNRYYKMLELGNGDMGVGYKLYEEWRSNISNEIRRLGKIARDRRLVYKISEHAGFHINRFHVMIDNARKSDFKHVQTLKDAEKMIKAAKEWL